ncbi:MAG: metallophosphoesterase [Gammaproteobacteria bacterium]|nr:metallophosphoesterase [Gammaproteobacteria bacterium]
MAKSISNAIKVTKMTNKLIPKRWWSRTLLGFVLLLSVAAVIWFGIALSQSQVNGDRAPYLQMGGPERMTIRWGTVKTGRGEVYYGEQADPLSKSQAEGKRGKNHRVILRELKPDTRYYYRVKQGGKWLMPEAEWFYTSPKIGSDTPTRIWVLGDPGEKDFHNQVSQNTYKWLEAHPRPGRPLLDFILTTGDNAYPNGTNAQYDSGFFLPFGNYLKNFTVWPAFGNHDARRWAFYRIFDRPKNAEFGGVASHDKAYFSFDYARTHIVMLDSEHGDLAKDSPMQAWLKQDLAQTRQDWVIVVFHHPPYTSGTHKSDNPNDSAARMVKMRENFAPILDRAGVDLVLSGHSHDYERTALVDCHYGLSNTFAPWMLKDKGETDANGVTHYRKAHRGLSPYDGTMYIVEGSSGEGHKVEKLLPVMVKTSPDAGSLMLDIQDQTLTARYVNYRGEVTDTFTITKGVDEKAAVSQGCEK